MSHGESGAKPASPAFLKAKFQIGSINGKQNYKDAERVFHPNDMPKPAKAARMKILAQLEASTAARATWWTNQTSSGPLHSGKMYTSWDEKPSEHKRLQMERDLAHSRDNTGIKLGGDATTSCDRPFTFTLTCKDAIKAIHELKSRTGFGARGVPSGTTMRTYAQDDADKPRMTDFRLSTAFDPSENRTFRKSKSPASAGATQRQHSQPHQTLVDRETEFMEGSRARKELMRTQALMEESVESFSYNHYKHDPLKTAHYTDSHPAREAALVATYTPKVLDTFMTKLAAGIAFAPPSLADAAGSTVQPLPPSDTLPHPEHLEAATAAKAAASVESSRTSSAMLSRSGSAHTFSTATALAASTILRKTNVVRQYEHQGAWSHSAAENAMAWSCCMSNDRNSRGCTVKVINRDRWNYEGPCSFDR